jgi:hypothetical protein
MKKVEGSEFGYLPEWIPTLVTERATESSEERAEAALNVILYGKYTDRIYSDRGEVRDVTCAPAVPAPVSYLCHYEVWTPVTKMQFVARAAVSATSIEGARVAMAQLVKEKYFDSIAQPDSQDLRCEAL